MRDLIVPLVAQKWVPLVRNHAANDGPEETGNYDNQTKCQIRRGFFILFFIFLFFSLSLPKNLK